MSSSTVAVLRVSPENVQSRIVELCQLAGLRGALSPLAATILKDNLSWHYPFPGANTTPWQLEGTIRALRGAGFADLSCVQNDVLAGEDRNHYLPILRTHEVPVLDNFRDTDMKWVRYEPVARMRVLHRIYPEGIFLPNTFFGKNLVHLPTVKGHLYTTTAGAMNNALGGLLPTHRHYTHAWVHETLVDLLAIQKEIHKGLFAVMDGTTAGNGPGPGAMIPMIKNVMLASADQVAIDAIAAKMMGFDPMRLPYIRMAHEAGLGVGRPEEITLLGDGDAAAESWGFKAGDTLASRVRRLLFHTPLVNLLVGASEVYKDYLRWPLHDRRVFTRWKRETRWGQLFEQYERGVPVQLGGGPHKSHEAGIAGYEDPEHEKAMHA